VQVDPFKPTLKAPGIKRLKLNCDQSLSSFAFKFNLRRYSVVRNAGALCAMCQLGTAFAAWRALRTNDLRQRKAGPYTRPLLTSI